jgi:protein phosphatase
MELERNFKEFDSATIRSVVISDIGNARANNEDAGLFSWGDDQNIGGDKGFLMLVADGMGGHNAGEVASRVAADIIRHEYFRLDDTVEESLIKAFEVANNKIFDMSKCDRSMKGMGTTCTAAVVVDGVIYYAHVGDSRAYYLSQDMILRMTFDHTYVGELLHTGAITTEQALVHPGRNILTNALGSARSARVDSGELVHSFREKDRLLVCSDGLYEYLNDQEIATIMNTNSLHQAANELVEEAKKRGGRDNITVVVTEKALGRVK